jgi:hypothetical protein
MKKIVPSNQKNIKPKKVVSEPKSDPKPFPGPSSGQLFHQKSKIFYFEVNSEKIKTIISTYHLSSPLALTHPQQSLTLLYPPIRPNSHLPSPQVHSHNLTKFSKFNHVSFPSLPLILLLIALHPYTHYILFLTHRATGKIHCGN